jgi:FkbM family methyltransferase
MNDIKTWRGMTGLKRLLRGRLERYGFRLVRLRRDTVGGAALPDDLSLLVPGDDPVIFDVGANVGQSIELFSQVFKSPRIFAFEPSERCQTALRNKYNDGAVKLFPFALGSHEQKAELREYELSTLNSLLPLDDSACNRFREQRLLRCAPVEIRTVDAMRSEMNLAGIDILKIDTQGFDLEVLKGASQSLCEGCVSVIQIELNFLPMYVGQAGAQEITNHLKGLGFSLVDYYEKERHGPVLAWCTALFVREPVGS